ncbi:MAG: hypothetical protein GVY04_06125 [Cyanobacteria bacterium]|jgi:hypothetical protein|nr:hypothetical protein [Cyanobacteria bacterium GSL.Bin1]
MQPQINCAEACVNGCVLGDQCPHKEYAAEASQFINNTSLDQMLDMAEEAVRKKRAQPPEPTQWVIPDDI